MFLEYARLRSNISADRMQQITSVLSENEIAYRIKRKVPFRMDMVDSATIGSIGRAPICDDIRYSVFVKKDQAEYALHLIRDV